MANDRSVKCMQIIKEISSVSKRVMGKISEGEKRLGAPKHLGLGLGK